MSRVLAAAREQSFEDGVRFGQLERMQAAASPSLRGTILAARAWTTLKAILLLMPLAAACAPFSEGGPKGYGVHGSAGPLDPGIMTFLMQWCLVLGIAGQIAVLVDWWHLGRRRDMNLTMASLGGLACCALILWWQRQPWALERVPQPATDDFVRVAAIACAAIAGLVVVLQFLGSRGGDAGDERRRRQTAQLQQLSPEEQRAILDERREILDVLHERGLINGALRDRAVTLPLGELWTLETKPGGK